MSDFEEENHYLDNLQKGYFDDDFENEEEKQDCIDSVIDVIETYIELASERRQESLSALLNLLRQ